MESLDSSKKCTVIRVKSKVSVECSAKCGAKCGGRMCSVRYIL